VVKKLLVVFSLMFRSFIVVLVWRFYPSSVTEVLHPKKYTIIDHQ